LSRWQLLATKGAEPIQYLVFVEYERDAEIEYLDRSNAAPAVGSSNALKQPVQLQLAAVLPGWMLRGYWCGVLSVRTIGGLVAGAAIA